MTCGKVGVSVLSEPDGFQRGGDVMGASGVKESVEADEGSIDAANEVEYSFHRSRSAQHSRGCDMGSRRQKNERQERRLPLE